VWVLSEADAAARHLLPVLSFRRGLVIEGVVVSVLVVALFWYASVRNVDQGLFFANKMSCSVVRLSYMGVRAPACVRAEIGCFFVHSLSSSRI
jgi:hypothetical protein